LDTEFAVFIFVSIFQLIERQAQSNRKVDDSVACHNDQAPYSYMTKLKRTETKSFNNYRQGGSWCLRHAIFDNCSEPIV